jgi:predicted acyltransferase
MTKGERLVSLDVFRGATIAGMILVNSPGLPDEVYSPVAHARWNGWTYADWIFPFFMFIVGVAMTLSFSKRVDSGTSESGLRLHILRRSAVIFALGLLVNGFPFSLNPDFTWGTFRIPGVLQRIAVCYLIVGNVALRASTRTIVLWTAAPMVLYWLAVMLVPVPGFGAGLLTPEGSLLWYVDSNVFGAHTWAYSPHAGFDPEGVISTIPAISTMFLGVLAGRWMATETEPYKKSAGLFVGGMLLALAGEVLSIWLPINKNMWTSTFVLFMGGWAAMVFSAAYVLIDLQGWKKWGRPFAILGMNAIAVYVLSELLWSLLWTVRWGGPDALVTLQEFLFQSTCGWIEPPKTASLVFAVGYLGLMLFAAWALWRRRWFIKV